MKHPCQDCRPPQRHAGCREDCPRAPAAEAFEQEQRQRRERAKEERSRGREADDFWADQARKTKRDLGR